MGLAVGDHLVRKAGGGYVYGLGAGKPFYPGGTAITIRTFQDDLRREIPRINVALGLIAGCSLKSKTYLGRQLVGDRAPVTFAKYLYDNAINPRLFIAALETITAHSTLLRDHLETIRLQNLSREDLATKLDHAVLREEIGGGFQRFSGLPERRKLELLEQLGVITLKEGHSLAALFEPPATPPRQLDLI